MLAVKAKYEDGTVRWERKPPVKGLHDLIVVFLDISDAGCAEPDTSSAAAREMNEDGSMGGNVCCEVIGQ